MRKTDLFKRNLIFGRFPIHKTKKKITNKKCIYKKKKMFDNQIRPNYQPDAPIIVERCIIPAAVSSKKRSFICESPIPEKKIKISFNEQLPLETLITQEWPSEPTYLAALNSHPYDWRVRFNPELHIYYVFYDEVKTHSALHNLSASTWAKQNFSHFEEKEDEILNKIVKNKSHLIYGGMTRQEIKQKWKSDADEASHKGTFYHLLLENHCNGFDLEHSKYSHLIPIQQYLTWRKDIFDPEFKEFRTEIRFHSSIDLRIVGTADLIAIRKNHGPPEKTNGVLTLSIFDWKNTKRLDMKNRYVENLCGTGACENVVDCNFGHYCIQQNIYKWLLETFYNNWTYNGMKYTSVKVEKMQLIVIHENNKDNKVNAVDVPDMSSNIQRMVEERKLELQKLMEKEKIILFPTKDI